jgi:hypothetical protein
VPLLHPIRALAKVMDDAEDESVIRMYIYSITDPYIVDIMVHCAKSKDIRIILNPEMYSLAKIQQFCSSFSRGPDGTNPKHVIARSMEFRTLQVNGAYCNEYTAMREKKIITTKLTLVGSYNLSYQARISNQESMYCIATTDQDIRVFDEQPMGFAVQQNL